MRLLFCSPLLILVVISVIPVVNALCGFFGSLIGVSFLLYLILWFAIPKARTPRQRLEMTGERITASSIRRNISARPERCEALAAQRADGFRILRTAVCDRPRAAVLHQGVLAADRHRARARRARTRRGARHDADRGAAVGFPFALAGGSLLIPVLIVLGIVLPLGIVVYLLLKLVFNLRSRRTTLSVLFGIWVLILIFLGVYLVKNYERIEEAFDPGRCRVVFQQDFRLARRRRSRTVFRSGTTPYASRRSRGRLDAAGYRSDRVIIPNSRSPFRQKRNGRLAFPSEPNRIKRRSYASIYRACSHPEESLCLLRSRVSYPVRSLP